jgi:hypothetical protein
MHDLVIRNGRIVDGTGAAPVDGVDVVDGAVASVLVAAGAACVDSRPTSIVMSAVGGFGVDVDTADVDTAAVPHPERRSNPAIVPTSGRRERALVGFMYVQSPRRPSSRENLPRRPEIPCRRSRSTAAESSCVV